VNITISNQQSTPSHHHSSRWMLKFLKANHYKVGNKFHANIVRKYSNTQSDVQW